MNGRPLEARARWADGSEDKDGRAADAGGSAEDGAPHLAALLKEALELAGAEMGSVHRVRGDRLELAAALGLPAGARQRLDALDFASVPVWLRGESPLLAGQAPAGPIPEILAPEGVKTWVSVRLELPAVATSESPAWLGTLFLAARRGEVGTNGGRAPLLALAARMASLFTHLRARDEARALSAGRCILHTLERTFHEPKGLDAMAKEVLRTVSEATGATAVGVSLWDTEGSALGFAASRMPDGRTLPGELVVLPGDLLERLRERREALVVPRLGREPRLRVPSEVASPGAGLCYAGLPLVAQGQPLGVLHLLFPDAEAWARQAGASLDALVEDAGVGLVAALAHEQSRATAAAADRFLDADPPLALLPADSIARLLLSAFAESCDVRTGAFFRYYENAHALVLEEVLGCAPKEVNPTRSDLLFRVGERRGLVGLAVAERAPIYVPDSASDPRWIEILPDMRSAYYLPVLSQEHVFGAIVLLAPEVNGFPPSRRALARLAGRHAGQTLRCAQELARIREAEQKYRTIFENAVEGLYQMTPAYRFTAINPALVKLLGYESQDQVLPDVGDGMKLLCVDRKAREAFLAALADKGVVHGFECKAGSREGGERWISHSSRAVRDSRGKVLLYEGTVEDIRLRKEFEDTVARTRKMEALARMATGLGHEFNNIHTAIAGFSGLLLDHLAPEDPSRKLVEEIASAGSRALGLTRRLRTFNWNQLVELRTLDLRPLLSGLEEALPPALRKDVKIMTMAASDLECIRAHPLQLEQVLQQLVKNAAEAMPKGGRILVEAVNATRPEGHSNLVPGAYVRLSVSDSGCGMTDDVKSRLFEPFFTTKSTEKERGLGLSGVYGIVQQSGGHIDVESRNGLGTTVRIYFPRAEVRAPASAAAPAATETRVRGYETILVAEDSPSLRNLITIALSKTGYHVLAARDGTDALRTCEGHAGRIHLLLTDLEMPGLSGKELVERALLLRPDLKFLYMSGHEPEGLGPFGLGHAGACLLAKPFSTDDLRSIVRRTLDAPAGVVAGRGGTRLYPAREAESAERGPSVADSSAPARRGNREGLA